MLRWRNAFDCPTKAKAALARRAAVRAAVGPARAKLLLFASSNAQGRVGFQESHRHAEDSFANAKRDHGRKRVSFFASFPWACRSVDELLLCSSEELLLEGNAHHGRCEEHHA